MTGTDEPDDADRAGLVPPGQVPRLPLNRDAFMSKPAALRAVCDVVAAMLAIPDYEELFGYDITRNLTSAQLKRLHWALGQVRQRLVKMGGARDTPTG